MEITNYDKWVVDKISKESNFWLYGIPIFGWITSVIIISIFYSIGYVWGYEGKKAKKQSNYDKWLIKKLKTWDGWCITTIPIIGWLCVLVVFGIEMPCRYMFGERK